MPLDDEGADRLGSADVAILGERHDNPLHHNAQARLIERVAPRAIVFEMIPQDLALSVDSETRADANRLAAHLQWEARGWPDFEMYWPIFRAAPEAVLFGAELSDPDVERAMDEGVVAVFDGWSTLFGLDREPDEGEQAAREAGMAEAHCGMLPPEVLPRMVEAQRARDAALARATLAAIEETGGPVAVITGNGHARNDWGVPSLLSAAAPTLDVVVLGQLEAEPDGPQPYDFWTVAPPPERGDPCEAFR